MTMNLFLFYLFYFPLSPTRLLPDFTSNRNCLPFTSIWVHPKVFLFFLWDPCYSPCCFANFVQCIRSLDCPLLIDSTVPLAEFKIGMSEICLLFLLFKINTQIMFGFFPFNNQRFVVELLIKLIISLTLITFLIPNHIIS